MKEIRLWITLVAAIPLLTGCNETESLEAGNVPLNFSTSVEARTRGADLTTSNLTSMGVFACYTKNGTFDANSSTPNYMYNEKIHKEETGGAWTYDNTMYWPADKNDKVSFFAYAPHDAAGVTLSEVGKTGYPTLTYTIPTTEANQTDLLASIPVMNQNGGEVNFDLKHALTKVKFIVKTGEPENISITVNSFSIKAKAQGVLTYTNTEFDWGSITGTETFSIPDNSSIVVPTNSTDISDIAAFYLLPDNTDATFSIRCTLLKNGETNGGEVTVVDRAIGTATAWTAGDMITYTITIKRTGIEMQCTTDGCTWEKDNTNNKWEDISSAT